MRSVYRSLDESQKIKGLIKWLSAWLAAQRGLPVLFAIGLTVVSLIIHIVWIVTNNALIGLCGFSILHIALLLGLIGGLLTEPLGRG